MSSELKFIHPDALTALHNVYVHANLKPVIVQTQGGVEASAGTHLSEGTYVDANGHEQSYSACIDFSVRQMATRLSDGAKIQMDRRHIEWFLEHCSEFALAGFYRTKDEGFDAEHMHVVCAMVPIEREIVIHQVLDFVDGKSGLKHHLKERYWTASDANDDIVARAFARANPIAAKRLPARFRK